MEGHVLAHIGRDFVQVGGVASRQNHFGESGRMRRQDLLLQAADRQHQPLQRHLTGHAHRVLHTTAGEQ